MAAKQWIAVLIVVALWPLSALATPKIQHWETGNGAKVLFVPAPEIPMLDVEVTFDAGAAREGGKFGLAMMTNGMLSEGAGGLTATEIAERFESVGASFGNGSARDMSSLSVRSLSDPEMLQPALETLALVLSRPDFPAAAFERERKRMLVALEKRKQQPDEQVDLAFYRAVFGDHPYGHDPLGTEETVSALTRQDLMDHYRRYYVARNAVVAIVGAVDRAQAERIAEQLVGALPAGEHAPPLPEVAPLRQGEEIRLQFPSTQAHIQAGQPGVYRGDPDYFPLYLGNHILGGSGLVSRLSEEVREKRGLSYSTYSYFIPMSRKGPFIMGLQTRGDQAGEALGVLRETLQEFVENGPTQAELQAAKKNLTGGFALRIASNSKIIDYISMIGFYDLPLDYLDQFIPNIQSVTLEQIRDAFQRRVKPDGLVTVILGAAQP